MGFGTASILLPIKFKLIFILFNSSRSSSHLWVVLQA
jgi:hypothetical protein